MRNKAHLTTLGFQDPTCKLQAASSGEEKWGDSVFPRSYYIIKKERGRGVRERESGSARAKGGGSKSEGERFIFRVCPGPSDDFL